MVVPLASGHWIPGATTTPEAAAKLEVEVEKADE